MSAVLLLPMGLAALAALAVPLLLHLRRRDEAMPADFAALRWLTERPRPRRRVRFDERLLLVLRLLLVAALALLLARPALYGADDESPRMLVAPGVDPAAIRRGTADARWLAPGFPPIATAAPAGPVPLSSLIRQFDAELPPGTPLTIVVPAMLEGVDAAPLRLTRRVTWRVAPGAMPRPREGRAGPPALTLVGADPGYFAAAAAAWGGPPPARSDGAAPPNVDRVLVWLRRGPVPGAITDWIGRGGTALLAADATLALPGTTDAVWRDAGGAALVEGGALGRGRVLRFTRPLTPAAMPDLLDPDFPARLRTALAPPAAPPARVAARGFAPATGMAAYPLPPRELGRWLAWLIGALFLAERWVATAAKRGATA